MNEAQKKILIAIAIGLLVTFLFPPHAYGDKAVKLGYSFIANIPHGASIHLLLLFMEWLGIALIGGIVYLTLQDKHTELSLTSKSISLKEAIDNQETASRSMSNIKRWFIRIVGLFFILMVYAIWRKADNETGGLFPGSALLRGALLWISLLWVFSIGKTPRADDEFKSEAPDEKISYSKAWPYIIGAVLFATWLLDSPEKKTNAPAVQSQSSQQVQIPNLSVNRDAEEMFNRAYDSYNQGKHEEALPVFQQLADIGLPQAQHLLGWMYEKGQGVTKDINEAISWYRKAAEQGEAIAQNNLGALYENGQGVTKDINKAISWYHKAAEQGYAIAQNNLGNSYYGLVKDYDKAAFWYRKAAEQGEPNAQTNLGYCYENGFGVTKDINEAISWYRKAAEQGEAIAQNNLGALYENGQGVTKDINEAISWYRKAAEQGYPIAQTNLGALYENGQGVTKDINEAISWYRKAATQGQKTAIENLKRLMEDNSHLNKPISKRNKKTTPLDVQPQLPQTRQTRSLNYDRDEPDRIPGDTNNDGVLSGSEQYLRDHH